jgi:hypothetical protein
MFIMAKMRLGRRPIWMTGLVVIFGLGCVGQEPAPSMRENAIIGGASDTSITSVGLLLIGLSGSTARTICTGTVVGSKTVLTATHCLNPKENTKFRFRNINYDIAEMVRHPSWNGSKSKYKNDIGLILLTKALPNVTPVPLARNAPKAGDAIKLVGMGKTSSSAQDEGVLRSGETKVAGVAGGVLGYFTVSGQPNICNGDSGGPAFADEGGKQVVVGVASAITGSCGSKSYHVIVAGFRDWLVSKAGGDIEPIVPNPDASIAKDAGNTGGDAGAVSDRGTVGDRGAGSPDGPPIKLSFGKACDDDRQCLSGVCRTIAGGDWFCSRNCQQSSDCPTGSDCMAIGAEDVCSLPTEDGGKSSDGGCAIGERAGGPLGSILIMSMFVVLRRRRFGRNRNV